MKYFTFFLNKSNIIYKNLTIMLIFGIILNARKWQDYIILIMCLSQIWILVIKTALMKILIQTPY